MRHTLTGVAAALALGSAASAQSFTQIVKTGDTITGVGNVTVVNGLAVDDSGNVLVHVITDNVDPLANAAMIDVNASAIVKEGDAVSQPSGATITTFNGGVVDFGGTGSPAFYLGLTGTTSSSDDEGLYYGTPPSLAIQESSTSTAPQLTSGSAYSLFLPPLINSSDVLAFHCVIDDPGISGLFNLDALIVADPSSGTQNVVYKEGDILPGQSFGITGFNWNEGTAFNDSNQVLFGATIASAPAINQVLYLNSTKIAQKAESSPFGSTYVNLMTSTTGVDLNNNGEYALMCGLNDGNAIQVNTSAFVRTGDSLPDIEPFQLEEIGNRVRLGDDGTVVWFGIWKLPSGAQQKGLFVDYTLLVEENVTQIGGQQVLTVAGTQGRDFTLSASGQYLIFECTLSGVGDTAFVIDLWQ